MPQDIHHPVLGNMSWDSAVSSWEARLELRPGCLIDLRLNIRSDRAPTDNLDALFDEGVAMLEWARRSEGDCREWIADELLEMYNDGWKPEEEPSISRIEFTSRLAPNTLRRDIDGSGYFYWADDGMFDSHWIEMRFDQEYGITEIGLAG